MLFSFAPQTAYAGGVVNAVADLVSSVVETVVDVAKEVMSNPVLGIVVSVALMVVFPYSGGVFGAIFPEATALFPAADFFGAALLGYNVLCATEVAFCGDDDNSNPGGSNSPPPPGVAGGVDTGVGANSASSRRTTSVAAGSYALASASCSTNGCECYGPTNSCGKAYQGTLEGSGSSAKCVVHGSVTVDLADYGPPPESSCVNVPKVTLSANPSVIDNGQASTLTWSSTNSATSCKWAGGFANLIVGFSGSASTGALTQTSTYQMTCTNPTDTSAPVNATVTVLHPEAAISAEPIRVRAGNSSTIKWGAKDVKSCAVTTSSGNTLASGNSAADYTFSTGSPSSVVVSTQTTYTITCQTNSDPIKKSILVNVVPLFEEF